MANIDKYLEWIREGRSFSDIRADLKNNGIAEDQINQLIAEIDDAAIQAASGGNSSRQVDWTKTGLAMMALGVLSYFLLQRIFHIAGSLTVTVILLAAGGAMIILGYKIKRKTTSRRSKRRFNLKSQD